MIADLGLNPADCLPGRLGVESLRKAATRKLADAAGIDADTDVSDLEALRDRHDDAERQARGMEQDLARIQARIPLTKELIRQIKGEMGTASVRLAEAEIPVCPVCEVPIDQALAEGCKLSQKLPDLNQTRQRKEQLDLDLQRKEDDLQGLKDENDRIEYDLTPIRERAKALHQQLRTVEKTRDTRKNAWYQAHRLIDEVRRLDGLLAAREQSCSSHHHLGTQIQKKRDQAAAFRDKKAPVIAQLSRFFAAIIREMIGSQAAGKVTVDGNGLKLSIDLGGERSTAAIDSLKVIAFDLAAMCMSIEGDTRLPAFLVHDSPREADLGLSVYHRLFHLAQRLEQAGEQPLFQYIITTTTAPPQGLAVKPWLRETLGGTANERLMKRDL